MPETKHIMILAFLSFFVCNEMIKSLSSSQLFNYYPNNHILVFLLKISIWLLKNLEGEQYMCMNFPGKT